MINIHVYKNYHDMRMKRMNLVDDSWSPMDGGRSLYTKEGKQEMIVHRHKFEMTVKGLNPDKIRFNFIPSVEEIKIAIDRLRAKKGSVDVMGETRYDHSKED